MNLMKFGMVACRLKFCHNQILPVKKFCFFSLRLSTFALDLNFLPLHKKIFPAIDIFKIQNIMHTEKISGSLRGSKGSNQVKQIEL